MAFATSERLRPDRRLARPVELEDGYGDAELPDLIEQATFLPAGVIAAAQGDQDVIRRNSRTASAKAVSGVSSPIRPRTLLPGPACRPGRARRQRSSASYRARSVSDASH